MNPPTPTPASPAPLVIAVADDVTDIQYIAREWLTAAGHVVACVANGHDLCRVAEQQHFDIVITDVMMPERDGFEVITELKRERPKLRIIAMSGGGATMRGTDCLRIAQRLGADVVLPKPFSRAQLLDAVAVAATAAA